jgi:enamine deaminase RidA (YjgF/YER057c/UK114 family)
MGDREQKLEDLGYPLSDTPKAAGLYTPLVVVDGIAYASGMVPAEAGAIKYQGKVPSQVSVEQASNAAALCAANLLRVCARDLGSLDKIRRIIKITGFVSSDADFTEQHVVMNGASALFIDVLGDAGRHARSAVGMANLPLGAAVEVELILQVAE